MSDEVEAWLRQHGDRPYVALEVPSPIAALVTALLEADGFQVRPALTADGEMPKAIVLANAQMLKAMEVAAAMIEAASEHLQDCPECRRGKHANCPGDTWDELLDCLMTCPCWARGHRALGTLAQPTSLEALRELTGFYRHPISEFPPGIDPP